MWNNWIQKICIKLIVNSDYYLNKLFYMRYVLFWLDKKTAQHTESHSLYEVSVSHLYCTADKVLNNLKNIYEDSDMLKIFHCIYNDVREWFTAEYYRVLNRVS